MTSFRSKCFAFGTQLNKETTSFLEYQDNSVDYLLFLFTGVATSTYRRSKSNAKYAGGTVGEGRGSTFRDFSFFYYANVALKRGVRGHVCSLHTLALFPFVKVLRSTSSRLQLKRAEEMI